MYFEGTIVKTTICASIAAGKQKRSAGKTKVMPFPKPRYAGIANVRIAARTAIRMRCHQTSESGTPQKGHSVRNCGFCSAAFFRKSASHTGHACQDLFCRRVVASSSINYSCIALQPFYVAVLPPLELFSPASKTKRIARSGPHHSFLLCRTVFNCAHRGAQSPTLQSVAFRPRRPGLSRTS